MSWYEIPGPDYLWAKLRNLVQYSRLSGSELDEAVQAKDPDRARILVETELSRAGDGRPRHLLPIMLDTIDLIERRKAA